MVCRLTNIGAQFKTTVIWNPAPARAVEFPQIYDAIAAPLQSGQDRKMKWKLDLPEKKIISKALESSKELSLIRGKFLVGSK